MTTHPPKARHVERLTVFLPIERIDDSGWLDVGNIREFVRMLDAATVADEVVARVWWDSTDERRPGIDVVVETKIDPRREP